MRTAAPIMARQPIFDADSHTIGYELLYRADLCEAPGGDATSTVVWHTWLEAGRRAIAGSLPIWLNVSRAFLLEPLPMEGDDVVLELPDDLDPGDEEVVAALRRLRAAGQLLALDNYVPGTAADALLAHAHLVKVDVLALGVDAVIAVRRDLVDRGIGVVATKVESRADFDALRAAGLSFFQGYFFERPRLHGAGAEGPPAIGTLRRCAELLEVGADLEAMEAVVREDALLSFRLIRLANSGYYLASSPIASVREALVRIGAAPARRWLTLLALHSIAAPQHPALTTALERARICETLAADKPREVRERCYLTGLFSVLDAVIAPLPELLEHLPLSPQIGAALLRREGYEGSVLTRAIAVQRGEAADASAAPDTALTAAAWADATVAAAAGDRQPA